MNIDDLTLTIRSHTRLKAHGIDTVEKLIQLEYDQLKEMDGLGDKSLNEIVWQTVRVLNGKALEQAKMWDERYPPEHIEQARRYREIQAFVSKPRAELGS